MDGGFELVVVAIDKFATKEQLPSSATAQRLAEMLRPYGAQPQAPPKRTTANALRSHLGKWARSEKGQSSSIVYWVGHGDYEGTKEWLLASGSKSLYSTDNAVAAVELAEHLTTRWSNRLASEVDSWTLIVLDCCNPSLGTDNIVNALTAPGGRTPRRWAVFPVASGASTVGRFVDELEAALNAKTENDDQILVRSLVDDVARRLGPDVMPFNQLPYDAAWPNPRRTGSVLTMTVDQLQEWRALVATMDKDVRNHFVTKAQSAGLDDAGWHFTGRHDEVRRVATWLRDQPSGLFVVTGEPGAGKSALLGEVVTLADERLVSALAGAELLSDRPDAQRPPAGVFDAVMHLTGKGLSEIVEGLAEAVGTPAGLGPIVDGLRASERRWTLLVDSLDEAQEPQVIAREVLRPLAELPNVRVVVGTRRSLHEGPDMPEPPEHELLTSLGVTVDECLFLKREPDGMAEYARRRLLVAKKLAPAIVDDIARRVATVDQPFLFVRLAVSEMLARAESADDIDVDGLLRGRHRDLFASALARLARSAPTVATLVRALAYGQGRGVPRTDAVWATIAGAVDSEAPPTEQQVDEAIALAAAYITLDGEAGQSVYRLAHKTFAEHIHQTDDLQAVHGRIAARLRDSVLDSGGWEVANPYVLLHLLDHAWADVSELDARCTDPGFLHATLRRYGAERLVENLVAVKDAYSAAAPAVAGAVRRARVALARHPEQLASQLQARLRDETDPAVVSLVARLPGIAPEVWLRSLTPHLTWRGDLEAQQDFPGKVRALAFGEKDGVTVLAVGVDKELHIWEPTAGGTNPRTVGSGGRRIIAAALGTHRGRPVAVLSSYEGTTVLRDIRTGEAFTTVPGSALTAVCLGTVDGRQVIAGLNATTAWWWDASTGELAGTRTFDQRGQAAAITSTSDGVVVALAGFGALHLLRLDGTPVCRPWTIPDSSVVAVAVTEADGRLLIALGDRDGMVGCWQENSGFVAPIGAVTVDFPVRTVAVGYVDYCVVVAAGNDAWDSPGEIFGRVALRQPGIRDRDPMPVEWLAEPVAISRTERGLAACCRGTAVRLLGVPGGEALWDAPTPADVAGVLTAGRHPALRFVEDTPEGTALRPGRPAGGTGRQRPSKTFRRSDPASWPVTADAYGVFRGKPVRATGSYAGASWIWDLDTNETLAGPFARVPASIRGELAMAKPALPAVRSMSLCNSGDQTLLGIVHDGVAQVWDVDTQRPLDFATDRFWSAIAVGDTGERLLVALGSDAGELCLYDLRSQSPEPVATMTTDNRIKDVWLVHGEPTLAAMTYAYDLLLFDFS